MNRSSYRPIRRHRRRHRYCHRSDPAVAGPLSGACLPDLILPVLLVVLLIPRSGTAQGYAALQDARWLSKQPPATEISADRLTAITRLPPRDALYPEIHATAELTFQPGKLHPGTAVTIVSPVSARGNVYCVYPGKRVLTCHARKAWVRTLTRRVTVRLRIDGIERSQAKLVWVLQR